MRVCRVGRRSVAAALVMVSVGTVAAPQVEAIYKGLNASVPPASWAAFIQNIDTGGTCTGTFVTSNAVLTAAHCVVLTDNDGNLTTTLAKNVTVAANPPKLRLGRIADFPTRQAVAFDLWDGGNSAEVLDVAVIHLAPAAVTTPIALAPPRFAGSAGLDLTKSTPTAYGFGNTTILFDLPPKPPNTPEWVWKWYSMVLNTIRLPGLTGPLQKTPPGSYAQSPAVCEPAGSACVRWDRRGNGTALLPGDSGGPWTVDRGAVAAGAHTTNIVQFGVSSTGTTTRSALLRGNDSAKVMDVTDATLGRWIADEAKTVFASSGGKCPTYTCLLVLGSDSWHVDKGFAHPADPATKQCLEARGLTPVTVTADELAQIAQVDSPAVCAPPAPLTAHINQAITPVDLTQPPYTPAGLDQLVAPVQWAVTTGALPAGISLDPATGALAGTVPPSAPYLPTVTAKGFGQIFAFTVTVTDAGGLTVTAAYELFVTERRIEFDTTALTAQLCANLSVPIETIDIGYGGASWALGAATSPQIRPWVSIRPGAARNQGLLTGMLRPSDVPATTTTPYTLAVGVFGGKSAGGSAMIPLTVTAQDPVVGSNCQFIPAAATVGAPTPCQANCPVTASIAGAQLTVGYPGGRCVAVSATLPATVFTPAVDFYYWDGVRAFRLPFFLGGRSACIYSQSSSDGLFHLLSEFTSASLPLTQFVGAGVLPGGQVFAATRTGPVSEPPLGVSNVVAFP